MKTLGYIIYLLFVLLLVEVLSFLMHILFFLKIYFKYTFFLFEKNESIC